MAILTAIVNQKGGVAKTTTAINLAHGLGRAGKKVLVVDCDPQFNCSEILSKVPVFDVPLSIIDLFADDDATFSSCCTETKYTNVDLIASNIDLAAYKNEISGTPFAIVGLKAKLDQGALDSYDYILFDCPPDLGGPLMTNALVVANNYIITIKAEDFYSLRGMQRLQKEIKTVQSTINPDIYLLGVLVTMCDMRTKVSRGMLSSIKKHFGEDMVFSTTITASTSINQATINRKSAIGYDVRKQGAKDYLALTQEFMAWANGKQ